MAVIIERIDNYQDIIDVRDITDALEDEDTDAEDIAELSALLAEMRGYGGDHQWQGDWYPAALIRDTYFVTYAQELADDLGAGDHQQDWPYTCIDWERAADELQMDYASVDYDGVIYWYR